MKGFRSLLIFCMFPLILLLASCIDEDYSDCRVVDGPRVFLCVNVDWSQFDKEVPTGMTVMVYPLSGGKPYTVLTNDITHADFSLEPGKYRVLVFNQSTSEFGTLEFQGMDSYFTAQVQVKAQKSQWYSRGEDEFIGMEPEWLGCDKLDEFDVLADTTVISMTPKNLVALVGVRVKMLGLSNMRYARGSLTGIARGYLLGQGKPLSAQATYLLEKWTRSVDPSDESVGVLETEMLCFGLPDGSSQQADFNRLTVSLLLADNKTQVDRHFSVGDQFEKKEGESYEDYPVVLAVKLRDSQPLPDVKPSEDGSGGGFDIKIDEWGKPEDIEMEI